MAIPLASCTHTPRPVLAESEVTIDDLILAPATVEDLMQNSLVFEAEYVRWRDYAEQLERYHHR